MEKALVWSSPPFGQHQLPSKCHSDLLLITLTPREIWSCIECLSGNLQDPERTWQSQTRQCLSHGNDVLEQLLSLETMKMSLLSLRVKVNWRGGAFVAFEMLLIFGGKVGHTRTLWSAAQIPCSKTKGRGRSLVNTELKGSVAERINENWENLNVYERWVSTLCYVSVFFYLQKHLFFRSARRSGSLQWPQTLEAEHQTHPLEKLNLTLIL